MGKYYFICHNPACVSWFSGDKKLKNERIAQELKGKKLCDKCFAAGWRLKEDVVVYQSGILSPTTPERKGG